MKFILALILIIISTYTYADSDGHVCIKESYISLEAKDIYLKVNEDNKHTIAFSHGGIERIATNLSMLENCVEVFQLPYSKPRNIILFKDLNHIVSLIVDANIQYAVKDEERGGGARFHHFIARVVKNKVNGDFVESLILGEGTRLETIH